jgi:hypothetical protein
MLAYNDTFRTLGIISLAIIPLMFLLKSAKRGATGMPAVH